MSYQCPNCGHKDAWEGVTHIHCPNFACIHFDQKLLDQLLEEHTAERAQNWDDTTERYTVAYSNKACGPATIDMSALNWSPGEVRLVAMGFDEGLQEDYLYVSGKKCLNEPITITTTTALAEPEPQKWMYIRHGFSNYAVNVPAWEEAYNRLYHELVEEAKRTGKKC